MPGFLNFTKEKLVSKVIEVEIKDIRPNPHQPRMDFADNEIVALAESISHNGILQPLSVRRIGDKYELIAGERRLRAAKLCGFRAVPCIVHEISERHSAILALVENIQRQDLSFFEEAAAIEKLITYYGMTQEEARKAILDSFDWKMKAKYEDKETDVTNLMADKVDQLLEEIYASDLKPGETYEVNTENMIEDAKAEAALIAGNWNMAAKSGGISGYNKETGKFEFSEGTKGLVIDQDKLAQAMVDAIDKKEFDAVLTAETKEVAADSSVQDKYKTMSTYTTTTTSNSNRNENIRLAVAALNGTIVKPGQEFSFNNTTGARTEEKGYKPATAYLNGEVVQEPGGGVCQVSSTLYNAVVFAGLKSTERHAHSYEPSYVTPGEDAAVSYGGPDFKFVNNSEYPLAIKASFSASDRKLTIALYGVPILKEGVKIRMSSEKTGEIDPPSAVYTEDGSLQPGQEVQTKAATPGSRWSTDLVTYENDKEVSREFFHNSSYRGKAAQIKRNSSATVATNTTETTAAAESTAAETNAANESTAAHETTTAAPSSPGGETKAPTTTAAESNEGPQETTPEPEETNPVVEANGPGSN